MEEKRYHKRVVLAEQAEEDLQRRHLKAESYDADRRVFEDRKI